MKNILSGITILLSAAAAGCSDAPDIEFSVPQPAVSVSELEISFGRRGGSATVAVSAAADTWDFSCTADWLSVSRDGYGLAITAAENGTDGARKAYIRVEAVRDGLRAADSVYVMQSGTSAEDLSAGETANCYIVPTGRDCRFDATVKGNGNESGKGSMKYYLDKCGVRISDGVEAELLWEATLHGNISDDRRVIDGAPLYSGGRIYFSSGPCEGNAVIALKDVGGRILWSWHIWVTDEAVTDITNSTGYAFMDRNLGAQGNIPGSVGCRGLEYQWGRKDPLLPSPMPYGEAAGLSPYDWETDNRNTGHGLGAWNYAETMRLSDKNPGNAVWGIENPMSFIATYFYIEPRPDDWFCINPDGDAYLWGDPSAADKTVFDPCPPGYAVPPAEAWPARARASHESYGFTLKETGEFYPRTGYRITYSGSHDGTDTHAKYWSRSMSADSEGRSLCLQAVENGEPELLPEGRAMSLAIRCVAR